MSRQITPGRLAVTSFVIGTGLLIPFDHPVTLTVGVLCLVACVVLGVFAIATPDALRATADEPDILDQARTGTAPVPAGSPDGTDDPPRDG